VARNDPIFCRLDIDVILNGGKVSLLDDRQFRVYVTLWALAVKHRSEVLSVGVSTPEYVQGSGKIRSRKGMRKVSVVIRELHDMGLIEILPSTRINVIGVKEVHSKLLWDKSPSENDMYIPISAPYGGTKEGESQRD